MAPKTPLHSAFPPKILATLICAALANGVAVAQIEFDESEIFFELNATDGDLGIQAFLDGEAWKEVRILGPG